MVDYTDVVHKSRHVSSATFVGFKSNVVNDIESDL